MLGSWQWGLVENVAPINQRLWAAGGIAAYALLAGKVAAGLASVVAAKVVFKQLLLALLPPLFDSAPIHVRQLWQPPVAFAPMQECSNTVGEAALAVKLACVAGKAQSDDSSSSSSSTSSSDSGGVVVGVTVVPRSSVLVRTSSWGSKVTVACNPAGVPWDVDSTARFLSYMAAVNTVWHFQALWGMAGL